MGTCVANGQSTTGMLYRRNRYFSPTSGQFTQADPIGIAAGMNAFGFSGGDPINHSDPFGMCPDPNDLLCATFEAGITLLGGTLGFIGGGGAGLLEIAGTLGTLTPAAVATAATATIGGIALGREVGHALSNRLFSESAKPLRGGKRVGEYDRHVENKARAEKELGQLREQLQQTKGPKAQRPIRDQIRKLEEEIKGHEKEIRQKWPSGRPE